MAGDLDKIANSTTAVVSTRLMIMVLPFLIAIIGWFASKDLSEIKETQSKFWQQVGSMNSSLSEIKTGVAVANSSFMAHQHDDNNFEATTKAAIADHEQRLRLIGK